MVEYLRHGLVAVLRVNNPPVNALSRHVTLGLKKGIDDANSDHAISSIVIMGAAKFLAGADIKEFGKHTDTPMRLGDLCDHIEASKKPVVSAIAGFALGGGLEIAISSHYRLATPDAIFGFPEVAIGILPGATGSQRFPRLVGLEHALDLIPNGTRFGAEKALKLGVIDKIVRGDLLQEAIQFAHSVSARPVDGRRTSQLPVKDADKATSLYENAVKMVNRKYPGVLAPLYNVKAVMASVETKSFEEGKMKEFEYSVFLHTSEQARALQYAFFAQRKAVQWSLPDGSANKTNVKPLPVKSVAVIGLGTMGTGIAMSVLNAGLPVILLEQNQQMLDRGIKALRTLYDGSVKLGHLSREQAESRLSQSRATLSYDELKDVDLVIEAVYEKLALKMEVFTKLSGVCKPDAVLCSNSSGLSIDKIAAATNRPGSVIGAHFFAPAYYMKLLEIVRGKRTSPTSIATASAFGQVIGKIPVVVGNCPGFVGNRMMGALGKEADFLLEEGSTIHAVDKTLEDFGLLLGVFKVRDLSGLDIGKSSAEEKAAELGVTITEETREIKGTPFSPLNIILVNTGRLGRKSGAGWYDYDSPGAKVGKQSAVVERLIDDFRKRNNITPRVISHQEIHDRLLLPMINEGFKVLEERVANVPEEIDTIFLNGFGWPRHTGGPMYYAKTLGLNHVYSKICEYSLQHPNSPHWQPSELLKKLAAENQNDMTQWRSRL